MEIFFVLVIAGVLITLLGHILWVVIVSILRALLGLGGSAAASGSRPTRKSSDYEIARQLMVRLRRQGRISEETLLDILKQIRALEVDLPHPGAKSRSDESGTVRQPATSQTNRTGTGARSSDSVRQDGEIADQPVTASLVSPGSDRPSRTVASSPIHPLDNLNPLVESSADGGSDPSAGQTMAGNVSSTRTSKPSAPVPPQSRSPRPAAPRKPVFSRSEVIQSFLSAHNIRWGELVAGLLIVVCSIGLVISLWSPLVEKHRVVPSLIFLAANTAIYAAGLYTLSRWKLRHTSRAVLVIASLLVPLSVLAGLAAAGTKPNAVPLDDPMTLIVLAVAGFSYTLLLYLGGKALSRTSLALPVVLAVAGPVATLPLIPAAIRTFASDAGWLVAFGSISVFAAALLASRSRLRESFSIGPAGGRVRFLVMGLGGFSLSVSIAYLAFLLRNDDSVAMLPIAIASIPAVVALAGVADSLMKHARQGVFSMAGAVALVLLVSLASLVLPPAMLAPVWLWMWAVIFSLSAVAVGWWFGRPAWSACATLPVGVVTVLTSKVWLAGRDWSVDALWTRLISGEAMVASLLMAFVTGVAWSLVCLRSGGKKTRDRWMEFATIGWTGMTLFIAMILTVTPASYLGVVPGWIVTLVHLVSVLGFFFYSLRDHRAVYVAVLAVACFWFSLLRPDISISMEVMNDWMLLASAITATLLVMSEIANWLATTKAEAVRKTIFQVKRMLALLACGFAATATLAALAGCGTNAVASTWTLVAVAGFTFWASTILQSVDTLRASQLTTGLLVAVVAYAHFNSWFFASSAWSDGRAIWSWAIAGSLVVALWWLIREMSHQLVIRDRIRGATSESKTSDLSLLNQSDASSSSRFAATRLTHVTREDAMTMVMPDGWIACLSITMVALGALHYYASLIMQVQTGNPRLYESTLVLPITALTLVAGLGGWMRRYHTPVSFSDSSLVCVAFSAILWLSCQLANWFVSDASAALIAATTFATIFLVLVNFGFDRCQSTVVGAFVHQASLLMSILLVTSASLVLMRSDWIDPIMQGELTQPATTLAVSLWWAIISIGLMWYSKLVVQPIGGLASLVLFAASVTICVPALVIVPMVVWLQVAALAALIWIVISRWICEFEARKQIAVVIGGGLAFFMIMGIATSLALTADQVFGVPEMNRVEGAVGCLLSVLSTVALCYPPLCRYLGSTLQLPWRVSWPVGVSLLAGQIGWLLHLIGWIPTSNVVESIVTVWVSTSFAALWTYRNHSSVLDFIHVSGVAVLTNLLSLDFARGSWMPWLALASLVAAGFQVWLVAVDRRSGRARAVFARLLGWFVGVAGVPLMVNQFGNWSDGNQTWMLFVLWPAIWTVLWRFLSRETVVEVVDRWRVNLAIPAFESGVFVFVAAFAESIYFASVGDSLSLPQMAVDPYFFIRMTAYLAVGASAIWRASRVYVWVISIGTLIAAVSLLTVKVSIGWEASNYQRFTWASLSSGFAISFLSHWLSGISRLLGRVARCSPNQFFGGLLSAAWLNAAFIAMNGVIVSIALMVFGAPAADIQISIVTVALAAWAITQMAEAGNLPRLRHASVFVGLVAIGLWASVDMGATNVPVLAGAMRWLVASVLVIPVMLLVIPKLLGEHTAARWDDALKRGGRIGVGAALGSLVAMFTMELMLRDSNGITGIPLTIVIGVALTLAALSSFAGVIAVASGPTSGLRDRLNLQDSHRVILIVGAQMIGVLTWLHVFLCRPGWAFAGLRGYWPYIVVALAFLTVGMTEWARRRGDRLMSDVLKQTALYLPLIPVIGFWLSGSVYRIQWVFSGELVRYDLLLAIGTVYYLGLAATWKGVMPRVTALVLGNAAWWVVLIQRPGWEFLSHPQLWLIPPAVCVLAAAHVYRQDLSEGLSAAIRYGCTLVIYISSTADMLIQQIGTTLSGPIVLILLALAGMLAGVVLRVRPFLYLGATFVLLGVTSMVWHAQRAFESVWPWWVFGISTGLILLIGLMAIEKYKPRLRDYANQLASWER